jgi:hypothetical protein
MHTRARARTPRCARGSPRPIMICEVEMLEEDAGASEEVGWAGGSRACSSRNGTQQ